MTILALDTSSDFLSVAIVRGNQTLSMYHKNNHKNHSEFVMSAIDEVIQSANITLDDIDLFAVAKGPGSFTGIRIGLSIIKAFAQVKNKPVVAVDSIESLCYTIKDTNKLICPMIDARANRVYTGLYKFIQGKLNCILPSCVLPIDALLAKINEDVIIIGDGAIAYQDVFPNATLAEQNECHALNVAQCGFHMFCEHTISHYDDVNAYYISIPQAERERLKKLEELK